MLVFSKRERLRNFRDGLTVFIEKYTLQNPQICQGLTSKGRALDSRITPDRGLLIPTQPSIPWWFLLQELAGHFHCHCKGGSGRARAKVHRGLMYLFFKIFQHFFHLQLVILDFFKFSFFPFVFLLDFEQMLQERPKTIKS